MIRVSYLRLTWLAMENNAAKNQPKIWALLINKEDKGEKVLGD